MCLMKTMRLTLSLAALTTSYTLAAMAAQPEAAELTFDSRWTQPSATNGLPAWVRGVDQQGGFFADQPGRWQVGAEEAKGVGRLVIVLDREVMREDLALSLLYDEDTNADVAVQLLDAVNRVVVLDVFGNLMAVGREARTDTFILPLRKYPTATKIVIRRISGGVRVFGAVLFPVVTQAEADIQTLDQLAKLLGDPLSPENALVKSIQQVAKDSHVTQQWLPSPIQGQTVGTDSAGRVSAPGASGPLDWYIQPFPVNSDWPGPKGEPAKWIDGELLLTGQPVRSRRSFSAPVTVSWETVLEKRYTHDGALNVMFEPEGLPLDRQGEQVVAFSMGYGHNGTDDGTAHLAVWQQMALRENFHPIGKKLWGEEQITFVAGELYRVTLEIEADGMRATVNGREYQMSGVNLPYRRFHIAIEGWQPTNRWHLHNFAVR
jgi:hypothetical protein